MTMIDLVRKPNSSRFTIVGLSLLGLVLLAGPVRPLTAQSNPPGTASGAETAGTSDPDSKPEQQTAQPAPKSQAAPSEGFKLGAYDVHTEFEFGYRWNSGIRGNQEMYRSQVNLFDGAQLLSSYVSLRSTPGAGLFDRLDLSLNNWGDPYNSLRFRIGRTDLYDFTASYRNLRYFNFISTLDNPLLAKGNLTPQHFLDVNYRMANFDLRLFPNNKIVPFVGYSHNSASGPGLTTFEVTGNQFLLNTDWLNTSDEYRGGVQFNLSRLNLTLEQGYRYSRNDTGVSGVNVQGNLGNTSFLGVPIDLDSLNRGYHSRLKLPTSRVLAKFTPFQNLRIVGRYIYSMGDTEADLGEIRSGSFVDLEHFLAYSTAADGFSGRAKRPNHNGSFLIEFSPISRITISDNVDTVDYHITGVAALSTLFLNASSLQGPGGSTTSQTLTDTLNTQFTYNTVRNQFEVEMDLGHGLSGRAGHRFNYLEITNDDSEEVTTSDATQNTAIVGLTYRPGRWLRFGIDYENTQTNRPLTRTDLFNYDQVTVDWRVGAWYGLSFSGKIGARNYKDGAPDIGLKGHDQNYTGSVNYDPNDKISIGVDFSRTNLLSDLLIVLPQNLTTTRSLFDQRIGSIGSRVGLTVYKGIKTEFGYRGIINKGTYPLEFHQPYASLWLPLKGGLAFKPTWQYFGFNYRQDPFKFQNYQTHLFTFALVFSR